MYSENFGFGPGGLSIRGTFINRKKGLALTNTHTLCAGGWLLSRGGFTLPTPKEEERESPQAQGPKPIGAMRCNMISVR